MKVEKIKLNLKEYAKLIYGEKSAPSMRTLYGRCRNKKIPNAIKEGGSWYVIVEINTETKIIL